MNVITCQVGQCGNQVAENIYSSLFKEAISASPLHQAIVADSFFEPANKELANTSETPEYRARSVLVDMEPKVVDRLLETKRVGWSFDPKSSFCKQEGSGNNWAFGFNHHGPSSEAEFDRIFSRIMEGCDYVNGFLLMKALAGGTGSGVGSFLVEYLKDLVGAKTPVINLVVLPHLSGEVILQYYNTIFSLSTLNEVADGIIIFDNENLVNHAKEMHHVDRPNFSDLNRVLSDQITSVLFPALGPSTSPVSHYSSQLLSYKLIETIASDLLFDPDFKLLSLKTIPQVSDKAKGFTAESWSALENRIIQMSNGRFSEYNVKWNITRCR